MWSRRHYFKVISCGLPGKWVLGRARLLLSMEEVMNRLTVDLIIPTLKPGKEFSVLLKKIRAQTYPVRRIFVVNTEEQYWDIRWEHGAEYGGTPHQPQRV